MMKQIEKPDPYIPVMRGQYFFEHGIPFFVHRGHLQYLRTCKLIDPAGRLTRKSQQ